MVGQGRLELPTSRLSSARSNQLSYWPRSRGPDFLSGPQFGAFQPSGPGTGFRSACLSSMEGIRRRRTRLCGPVSGKRRLRRFCVSNPSDFRQSQKCARILRKEVIQPQVPLRLPCYDFTPVADLTVVGCLLAVSAPASGKTNSHGVTGGVYKARERIHRGMLIRDY